MELTKNLIRIRSVEVLRQDQVLGGAYLFFLPAPDGLLPSEEGKELLYTKILK